MQTGRPTTLGEVAAPGPDDLSFRLREFLDEFYVASKDFRQGMIDDEPTLLGVPSLDAYLAATAEHLAREYSLQVPDWTEDETRFLKRAYFPGKLKSLMATHVVESPVAFRRRLIFVEATPLYRPRKDVPIASFLS